MTSVIPVPEGHATVAQRFNAGCRCRAKASPEGTDGKQPLQPSLRDSGLPYRVPAFKRWAISRFIPAG
jgi:hypothetical protein